MPFRPRRATGPRAWWLDVVVSVAVLATAQILVMGSGTFLERVGRGAGGLGFEASLALERAPGDSDGADRPEPLGVTLDGTVTGLYPGAQVDLALKVSNLARVAVQLDRLTITVGTPDREGCPAEAIHVGAPSSVGAGSTTFGLRLAPAGTATLIVPVSMVGGAPSACQGATFPLEYHAEGTLP
jgi:hypothetical protein